MNVKRSFHFTLLVVLTMTLAACTRPASKAPTGTPTIGAGEGIPVPDGTQTMGMFDAFATQTALATMNIQPLTQATDTPAPPAFTATPAPPTQPAPTNTPAAPVVPTATPGIPASYTLQKDEFPYCIARRFNVNPYELMSLNGLNASSVTYPGLVLKIPQTGKTFPGDRSLHDHPASYTVKSGDTIYKIACYYGDVDPLAVAAANNLSSPYTLTAGQTLQIP